MSELFFLEELERRASGLAPGVTLAHPFLLARVRGAQAVLHSLRTASRTLGHPVVRTLRFEGEGAAAVAWSAGPPEREIHGVTYVALDPAGWISDVRIALRPLAHITPWRERLQAGLAEQELPGPLRGPREDPSAPPADPNLPLPLDERVVLHSPAFTRPIVGAEALRRVIGHARAIYGECETGPALRCGSHVLRALTSALPLEMVSIARLDGDGRVAEWSVLMQPWPAMMLFSERLRARLGGAFDDAYHEPRTVGLANSQ